MGASVGTGGGKGDVNVELNIVPFIDLMSCLTAFLLATAVWTSYSQIDVAPKGIGRKTEQKMEPDEEKPNASILITENEIWAGVTVGPPRQIRKEGDDYDWEALSEVLKDLKATPAFADRGDIELAADDNIEYQQIITAMDKAINAEFVDIGLVDPNSLSVRFRE